MKIAFVVGNFPSISQTFILNQIAGLFDLGHEVDVLSYGPGDAGGVHPIVEKYGLLDRTVYLWKPGQTWRHRFVHGDPVFWGLFRKSPGAAIGSIDVLRYGRKALSLALTYETAAYFKRGPYDIVHCQFGTFGLDFLPLHRISHRRSKLVVQFRGYDISQFLRERGPRVYDRLFGEADHFLTNCEYFKKRLLELGAPPDRTDVLYSGIDLSKFRFSPRKAAGTVRIAMIGRLVEKKGVEYVIRALGLLAEKGLRPELHLIGDGPLEGQLRDLCHTQGVERQVYFLGACDQRRIIEVLDGCQLFAAPSVTASTGDEDAPVNVLKEAMAMGLPVVSTRHGGIPELVEEGVSGYLVPERDAVSLAERLARLIECPSDWEAMGRAGRKRVEDSFDMLKLNRRLEEIYRRLLSEKRR